MLTELFLLLAPLQAIDTPQPAYTEVSARRGIAAHPFAPGLVVGASAADYDGDGDIDIFAGTRWGEPDRLYRNIGGGMFEEIAASVGLDSTDGHRGGLWFDADSDGDLDLVVTGDLIDEKLPPPGYTSLRLYLQEPDGFVEITAESGLEGNRNPLMDTHAGGLCAGDIDLDGDLDLCATFWEGGTYLFKNDGKGKFEDVSAAALGLTYSDPWQPVFVDLNRDGWLDLFQAVDFFPNQLWVNDGTGHFRNVAPACGVASAWNEMGVAIGGPDNDGDFDLYVTNLFLNDKHNRFYRNDSPPGGLLFNDIAPQAGVDDGGCGWGASFFDASNRGLQDLATTNSGVCDTTVSKFFQNRGAAAPVFKDASNDVGFNAPGLGGGMVTADINRDGDLDILHPNRAGKLELFDATLSSASGATNYLVIRPRMPRGNTHAIGAIVRVRAEGRTQSRLITAGISILGQEPAEAHFGLGAASSAKVLIEWPNGEVTRYGNIAANQVVTIEPKR